MPRGIPKAGKRNMKPKTEAVKKTRKPRSKVTAKAEDARLLAKVAAMTVEDAPKKRGRKARSVVAPVAAVPEPSNAAVHQNTNPGEALGIAPETASGYLVSIKQDVDALGVYFLESCQEVAERVENSATYLSDDALLHLSQLQGMLTRYNMATLRLAVLINIENARLKKVE